MSEQLEPTGEEQEEPKRRVAVDVPVKTLLKLALFAVVVAVVVALRAELLMFVLALILAIALDPLVQWFERRRISRGLVVLGLALATLGLLVFFAALVLPPFAEQAASLVNNLPDIEKKIDAQFPPSATMAHRVVHEVFALPSRPEVQKDLLKPLAWGEAAFAAVATFALVVATVFYLLADGRRAWAWLVAYVPAKQRPRVALSVREITRIVSAYVRGQAITSGLFAGFVAVVLLVFHVPGVLPLAVLAAICDIVPVAGIIVATLPAAALGFAQSPTTGIAVTGLYAVYHALEAYAIAPRVYGQQMRLSTLAVVLALVVGGVLGGLLGAVLILPIVAAYPAIERIWFKDRLGERVIEEHRMLDDMGEHGTRKQSERAARKVLHPDTYRDSRPSRA